MTGAGVMHLQGYNGTALCEDNAARPGTIDNEILPWQAIKTIACGRLPHSGTVPEP